MAAIVRRVPLSAGAAVPRVLAESALGILVRRRNSGGPVVRMSCRALIRGWLAVARGAA